ncbi:MAG TPA: SRPBCC family protein [Terriglobia bacterium]|nr:SRPBCC family protein [Terriglobia bacterium]
MSVIEKTIEINVPVKTAYNQWTQFEEFPRFMEGVEQVRQIDDKHLHFKASIGGKQKEWDAVITEQIPDQRIAWMSRGDSKNGGVVIFSKVSENKSKLNLRLEYEPEGAVEKTGDTVGVVSGRVEGDLRRFKDFIESRGQETGAWRGKVA